MAEDRRSLRALAALLPAGAVGMSVSLASADAAAMQTDGSDVKAKEPGAVAQRLQGIREDVSQAMRQAYEKNERVLSYDPETQLAWWGNGWRGGWPNWHNWGYGGWHNGWPNWHNGWGNGPWGNGWHNWGNGLLPWSNGWNNW